jgi:phospholipase C
MTNSDNSKIEHVIVIMFENRSFDHMLGAFPGANGVLLPGGEVNPDFFNTMSPTSPPDPQTNPMTFPAPIDLSGQSGLSHDFNHDFGDGMMPDLFGPGCTGYVNGIPLNAPVTTYPATNSGFLSTIDYNVNGYPNNGPSAMYFFENGALKVFHKLASEFVVCDNWHCDMPGHTMPNRAFMHCATTGDAGIIDNDIGFITSPTIFGQIENNGHGWKMYSPGGQVDASWIQEIQSNPNSNVPIADFCNDLQNGTLPFYSFILCWCTPGTPDVSMHPASTVQAGENYLAAVYNALRNSQYWKNTLLVVNFDENGGMYDHVPPPSAVPPLASAPVYNDYDSASGTSCSFDFSLLGVRIPVLLISPWLSKGIDSSPYQNTSILRYIQDKISEPGQPQLYLTQRDKNATSIAAVFEQFGLDKPRTDCPEHIEGYKGISGGDICNPQAFVPTAEQLQQPPLPHLVAIAKEYLGGLPGHPDSGKPITRTFATNAELIDYTNERAAASIQYAAANKK